MTKHNTSNTVFAVRLINGQPAHMDIYEDMTMDEVTTMIVVSFTREQFIGCNIEQEHESQSVITINGEPMWMVLDGAYYDMFSEQPAELN